MKQACSHCSICGRPKSGCYKRGTRCPTCVSKIRRGEMKLRLVEFMGGRCVRCNWKPKAYEVVAMEFHHGNGDKDFELGNKMNHKWETLIAEASKCELVCSRCHRILHSRYNTVLGMAERPRRRSAKSNTSVQL